MLGGLFCGADGKTVSSRRVIAFLYAIAGIVSGGYCIYTGVSDWKVVAVAFGLPSIVCVFLLLFTTWLDICQVADAVRGNRHVEIHKEEKCVGKNQKIIPEVSEEM